MEPKVPSTAPKPPAPVIELSKNEGSPTALVGEVLKMTSHGCLVRVLQGQHLKVGDNWIAKVRLPEIALQESVKVMKTYDLIQEVVDKKNLIKSLNIELHFRNVSEKNKQHIAKYLESIGPKKP